MKSRQYLFAVVLGAVAGMRIDDAYLSFVEDTLALELGRAAVG